MAERYSQNLAQIAALALARRDEFEVLMYRLQDDDDLDDARLDQQIEALAAPIVAAIDCTQCANCCRHLRVYLEPEDTQRLANGLSLSQEALEDYLERSQAQQAGEWASLRLVPCAFLRDSMCSIYPHRPNACRLYPQFTPDFRWVLGDLLEGARLCPIIYHVLDALSQQIDAWLRE
ncbi:MAG: YkgJ family cysteine cluster protein [Anaerolineae bacterium]|nr:YkgJ family cysteine cluster protein [Anaerolineae bacterium]MDW8171467.1 YkgJ family cysteine cluster protein [Anaerolineae bacterium]